MVMAVVTAHILSPSSELEKLLPVKIHVLSLFAFFLLLLFMCFRLLN